MPKIGMEPIRKNQVINATLECISESGFEKLTLESVAKKAGISKDVVSYYFKGKEDLILQAFRAFLDHYNKKVGEALSNEASALKMLEAMIDIVVFTRTTPMKLSVWKVIQNVRLETRQRSHYPKINILVCSSIFTPG